jgi:hypothetical protein
LFLIIVTFHSCGEGHHPLLSAIREVLNNGEPAKPIEIAHVHDEQIPEPPKAPEKPEVKPPVEAVEAEEGSDEGGSDVVSDKNEYIMVCYFTNWAWYRYTKI